MARRRTWSSTLPGWLGHGIADLPRPTAPPVDTFVYGTTMPVFLGSQNPLNNVGIPSGLTPLVITAADLLALPSTTNPATGAPMVAPPAGRFYDVTDAAIAPPAAKAGWEYWYVRSRYSYSGDVAWANIRVDSGLTITAPIRFYRCEVTPDTPGDRFAALYGQQMIFDRCASSHTVDGSSLYSKTAQLNGTRLLGSWLGNPAWFNSDWSTGRGDGHPDGSGTHNDAVAQLGGGGGVTVNGCFAQGARYNALNPANVQLTTSDWMDFLVSAGNGTDLLVDGINGTGQNPPGGYVQSGNGFLSKADAYFNGGHNVITNNWFWNLNCGVIFQSAATRGTFLIPDNTVTGNRFGGRWLNNGGTLKFYPIRYDNNTQVNGAYRAGGTNLRDTWGNVWDSGANPGFNNPDGTPMAGSAVYHRLDTVTAATS